MTTPARSISKWAVLAWKSSPEHPPDETEPRHSASRNRATPGIARPGGVSESATRRLGKLPAGGDLLGLRESPRLPRIRGGGVRGGCAHSHRPRPRIDARCHRECFGPALRYGPGTGRAAGPGNTLA